MYLLRNSIEMALISLCNQILCMLVLGLHDVTVSSKQATVQPCCLSLSGFIRVLCIFINETHIFDAYNLFECFYFCLIALRPGYKSRKKSLIFKKQKMNKCASLVT